MNKYQEQFQSRISAALNARLSSVLLSDDKVSWTGQDILNRVTPLKVWIQKSTFIGARVGVSFPEEAVQGLAILAVVLSGRVPVILSYQDLKKNPDFWIAKAKISTVITVPDARTFLKNKISYTLLSNTGEPLFTASHKLTYLWLEEHIFRPEDGTALVLFTSGTTGEPKGVLIPAQGLMATIDYLIQRFGLNENTRSLIQLPICHSMALNTQFLPTFLAGGHCHFSPSRLSLNSLYRTILNQKGTFLSLISEILQTCRNEKNRRGLPAADLVEHIQLAGGKISERDLENARELFPNAVIHKGYGLTEAIRVSMISSLDANFKTDSVGQALPFVEIQIRQVSGQLITEPDVQGQIFVKGPNVLLGFSGTYKSPVDKNGFFATGDIGSWNAQKELCVFGRNDSLFKINGHRVSGYEIERMARESSDLIRNAKCTMQNDSRRQGQKVILMLEIDKTLQPDFLKHEIANFEQKLWANFQALNHSPKEILIMERFPKTSNGKISILKLNELYQSAHRKPIVEKVSSIFQFFQLY